jgi:hypothetical protein
MEGIVIFREVQRFRQTWIWVILLSITALGIYFLVKQLVFGEPVGNNPASDWLLIVLVIVVNLGFPAFFYFLNLTVEVRTDGLYYRYFPFHLSFKKITYDSISKCEVRSYSALKEYGGWGIRYGRYGKAYNVSGNQGVQLEFMNGEKLLFGSKRAEELAQAIISGMGT